MHRDIEDALARLKAANAEPRRNAEFVQAVLADVRFYVRDAHDPALDRRCIEGEVEKDYAQMFGPGVPLVMRPPFDTLGRWSSDIILPVAGLTICRPPQAGQDSAT